MLAEFDRCAREGTPRPESQAVRAHVPAVFWSFANSLARRVQERRRRSRHQGAVPHLCVALGQVRVLRQPALDEGGHARASSRTTTCDLINFESLDALRRAPEGRAVLCGGDHLGPARRRRVLGAAAQAFQRAGAGRDRLFRGAHHGPAALAAHARYRAPPDPRRHRRLDGARLRDRRGARTFQAGPRLLGPQGGQVGLEAAE